MLTQGPATCAVRRTKAKDAQKGGVAVETGNTHEPPRPHTRVRHATVDRMVLGHLSKKQTNKTGQGPRHGDGEMEGVLLIF